MIRNADGDVATRGEQAPRFGEKSVRVGEMLECGPECHDIERLARIPSLVEIADIQRKAEHFATIAGGLGRNVDALGIEPRAFRGRDE